MALLPDSLAMSDVETEIQEMQWAAEVRDFVIQDLDENFGGHFGAVEEPGEPCCRALHALWKPYVLDAPSHRREAHRWLRLPNPKP